MNKNKATNIQSVTDELSPALSKSPTCEPFFIVPSKVFEYDLSPYELSALFYLCMRADNKTHSCYPSEKRIAKACGMSLSTVKRIVKSLEEKGIINVKKQFSKSPNGLNRQTANLYTVTLFKTPHSASSDTPISPVEDPPQLTQTREINKSKPILTKSNITKSTELSLADAKEILKERNNFLDLKNDCFEKLKNDHSIGEEHLILIDRALENLWHKPYAEYEGTKYKKEMIQTLLSRKLTPSILAYCMHSFENVKDPVRSPVAYLSKCILGAVLHPESTKSYANDSACQQSKWGVEATTSSTSSFDLDDFFNAALERSMYEL